ncbi:MAG: hypothetical protein Q9170_006756 [Blastenia crenularia]
MASILKQSLASKVSNESFHSTHSNQQPPSPTLASVSKDTATDLHAAALKAAGLPIYDIQTYLNEPRNQETLTSPSQKKQKVRDASSSSSCTPVQLGAPITTHHVSALHQLCQERGLRAEFEIDGDQVTGFSGMVTIEGQTVASEQRWRNKKEAKEGLAALGLPVVREMEAVKREKQSGSGEQDKNWSITTQSTQPTPPRALSTPNTPLPTPSPAPAPFPPSPPPLSAPPPPPSPPKKPPGPTPQGKQSTTSSPPANSAPTAAPRPARKSKSAPEPQPYASKPPASEFRKTPHMPLESTVLRPCCRFRRRCIGSSLIRPRRRICSLERRILRGMRLGSRC